MGRRVGVEDDHIVEVGGHPSQALYSLADNLDDWKPIVISRRGSSPADDAMCKVTLGVIPISLLGLSMMHVLVVTHLFGCAEI